MITVYSEDHLLRNPRTELHGGELVEPHECPQRALFVLDRIHAAGVGAVIAPARFGMEPVLRVHDRQFVEFLQRAWNDWVEAGNLGEAIPDCWPARRMLQRAPGAIGGRLGYYAMAAETSIDAGSWEAALSSVNVALTGAQCIQRGEFAAFALCRPPGHHAAKDLYGGYCFLNNAAIAAQNLLDNGAQRVAVLDVDFHHGNGTQDIFFDRSDVLYVSIHGDPAQAFPYFSGFADETGSGAGSGFNLNLPLPPNANFQAWSAALMTALARVRTFAPDVLVVSLGVDTFEHDPISFFKLTSADFLSYGRIIGALGIPTLFVLEGGYAVAEIGVNVVNVLTGFDSQRCIK